MRLKVRFLETMLLIIFAVHGFSQHSEFPVLTNRYLGQKPPGMTPKVFAPGIISTKDYREFSGAFTPDGTEYYFFRFAEGAGMMVTRLRKGAWTAPEPASFNTEYIDNEPHITPDGQIMFFNSNRPFPGSREGRRPTQIWFMERVGTGWNEPKHLCEGMFATASKNGNVYLNRGVTRFKDGKIEPIREIVGALNAPPDGWRSGNHSSIAPDESFLIYDSQPSADERGSDENLFVCFRRADGSWSESFDLSGKLNLPGGEMLATITADGKYLFFCNGGDIYWVDVKIIEELRPKEIGMMTLYIEPGSPWENGHVESHIRKLPDELLNGEILDTLMEAKVLIGGR
jgi:hypothetical protein